MEHVQERESVKYCRKERIYYMACKQLVIKLNSKNTSDSINFSSSCPHQCLWVLFGFSCKFCNVIDDGGKVGRPPQLHRPQGGVVGLNDPLNPKAVGIGGVTIEGELVGHVITNFTTEPKSWKQLVTAEGDRKW